MKKKDMSLLYSETFNAPVNDLPGGWYVEQNTDMPQVPAIACGDHCVELLSAGNKFLPVIPDTADCQVDCKVKINYAAAEQFGFMVCFRYDTAAGRGQFVRFQNPSKTDELQVDYGTTALNYFTSEETQKIKVNRTRFEQEIEFWLIVCGNTLRVKIFNHEFHVIQSSYIKGYIARILCNRMYQKNIWFSSPCFQARIFRDLRSE